MMSPRLLLALIAVLCSSLPAAALANPPAAETSTQVGELFDQAQAAFAKGDKQGARAAYLKAWALQKSYDIAGNLGNVELKLGMFRDAAEHLAYGVENFPPTGEPALLRALKEKLAEARKEVGRVRVRVDAEGVKVMVNGKAVGALPLSGEVYVEPGGVVVEGELSGYEPGRVTGRVGKGETVDLTLPMMAKPRPRMGIVIGGMSAAAVGFGVGIGLLVAGNAKLVEADNERTAFQKTGLPCPSPAISAQCKSVRETLSSASSLHNGAVGALLGASAVSIGTIAVMLSPLGKSYESKKAARTRVTPIIGGSMNGLLITGSF